MTEMETHLRKRLYNLIISQRGWKKVTCLVENKMWENEVKREQPFNPAVESITGCTD